MARDSRVRHHRPPLSDLPRGREVLWLGVAALRTPPRGEGPAADAPLPADATLTAQAPAMREEPPLPRTVPA